MSLHRTLPLMLVLAGTPDIDARAATTRTEASRTTPEQHARAIAWLRKGEAAAAQIHNNDTRAFALYKVVVAMVDVGEFQAATEMANRIDDVHRGGARTHLAAAQIKAGDMEGAKRTLREALADERHTRFRMGHDPTIAKLLAEAGAADDAAATIEQIKTGVNGHGKPFSPADRALLLIAAGDLPAAAAALADVGPGWVKGNLYAKLAAAYLESGDRDRAREALRLGDFAIEHAGVDEVEAAKTQNEPRRALAEVWVGMGEFREAQKLAGASKCPMAANFVRTGIAEAQASRGDIDAAKATVSSVTREDIASSAWAAIAAAQARAGRYDEAQEMAESIKYGEDRASAHRAIGEAQAKAGDRQAARASFDRARAAAASADDVGSVAWFFGVGDIDDVCVRGRVYPALAESQARAGDLDALATWVDAIPSPYLRAITCAGAARGFAETEKGSPF